MSAPTFSTNVSVDADVDVMPEDLERAGWVFVGKGDKTSEQIIDIVRSWHERTHAVPWRWCDHELCDAVRGRGRDYANEWRSAR